MVTASWSLQRAHHGEQPYWAVVLLASALGQIGLPGGGFGFGYGSGAGIADAPLAFAAPAMDGIKNPINVTIPAARISDCLLHPGEPFDFNGKRSNYPDIRLVYWAGGNPFHHHQDINKLRRAFARPETVVVHEPWWTATARHADIVLPATTSLERNDIGGARRDRYIMAMQRAIDPVGEARNDFAIFSELARRLGSAEAYTQGRDENAWLRHLYDQCRRSAGANALPLPDFDTFWEQGYLEIPAVSEEYVLFGDFRADPEKHKLRTPSGRIELYSEKIAGFGYDDCPPHPTWLEPWEWLGGEDAETYPLHLVSSQPRDRLHSQMDCGPVSAGGKVAGREAITLNPADAAARGIRDGDVVRVHNARGSCLAGAIVSDVDQRRRGEALMRRLVRSGGRWRAGDVPARQSERADARPGHLEARAGAELGDRAGRGRALDRSGRAGPRLRAAAGDGDVVGLAKGRVAHVPITGLAIGSLPAGRHHSDRCRGPARAEAAAVPAAAVEARIAPAVIDVTVGSRRSAIVAADAAALPEHRPCRLEAVDPRAIAREEAITAPALLGDIYLGLRAPGFPRRGRGTANSAPAAATTLRSTQQEPLQNPITPPASPTAACSRSRRLRSSALSFAQTMLSATIGSVRTAVPKPQSTPAITRSRPTMSA